MADDTQEQCPNSVKVPYLAPYQFKPGQSGNPGSRPKGARITREIGRVLRRLEAIRSMAVRWLFLSHVRHEAVGRKLEASPWIA
jgi:hypothetical protein